MDRYKELQGHLARMAERSKQTTLYQGIVTRVGDLDCEVEIDGLVIPDVRLRASLTADEAQLIIRPAVGAAVIVGSLTGDLDQLVVLSVDRAEEVIINGGKLGGLIKVEELTSRFNALERDVNQLKQALSSWMPIPNDGGKALKGLVTSWASRQLTLTKRADYEDQKVKH